MGIETPPEFRRDILKVLEKHYKGTGTRAEDRRSEVADELIELIESIGIVEVEIGYPGSGSGAMDASLSGGTESLGNLDITRDAVGDPRVLLFNGTPEVVRFEWTAVGEEEDSRS